VAAYESEKTQHRGRGAKSYFIGAEFDKAEELGAEVAGQGAATNKGLIDRMRRRHFADLRMIPGDPSGVGVD